jgi:uncharacterized protein YigA (DUF484 family)
MVILMSNMDERIRELEEEVQALMQEAETQKKVNIDMQEQLGRRSRISLENAHSHQDSIM